jgi:hypothetical protein
MSVGQQCLVVFGGDVGVAGGVLEGWHVVLMGR